MLANIQLTIGHNVGSVRKWTTADICAAFEMVTGVEAYTAVPCYGMWRGMAEESTRLEVVTEEPEKIANAVPALADLLEQEAIMLTVVNSTTNFVVPVHA